MRKGIRVCGVPVFAVAVAAIMAACGSSSTGPNTSTAALVGTYTLTSITFTGQPTLTPPAATGNLTLGDSTYDVVLHLPAPAGTQTDSGTYKVSGNQWTQMSASGQEQAVGTYSLSGGQLTVDVSEQGQQVTTVWQKQTP